MSQRGVVMFAFNTPTVDYFEIASRAAKLVKHTLNLPTTIITDEHIENTLENKRIGEYEGGTQWRNGNRFSAYDLSPYDETLLIDSDYLMLDKSAYQVLNTLEDYQIVHNNKMLATDAAYTMGITSLPYVWATVIAFKKTQKAKQLFDLAGKVQRNYAYYCKLFQIDQANFRNDYAFTIANHILNGYATDKNCAIPFTMLTLKDKVNSITAKGNLLIVKEENRAHAIAKQNIHVIDKQYLLSDIHLQFIKQICV
jgi:hypothetical protein